MMAKSKTIQFETTFAKYIAIEPPRDGGCGRVYKVRDGDSTQFALKLLKPESLTTQRLKRFKNELQFCKRLVHGNVVSVVDDGFAIVGESKVPFYVMPYYPETLRDSIKSGIQPERVLKLFSQILDGVEAAHKFGITHRDIKPENILCNTPKSELVIADFGIAEFSDEELYTAIETNHAERLANFQYAAPEQRVRGQMIDSRADIYALGLILNEMFTGKVIHGTGYETVASVSPNFAYLDGVIEVMIKQKPDARPASIEEIKKTLIARGNEFISKQKLDDLKSAIIPTSQVSDPLIRDPVNLVDVDYQNNNLVLILDKNVNREWIDAFHSIGNYSFYMGQGPHSFAFNTNKATISVRENQTQQVVDWFKGFLEQATQIYKERLERVRIDTEKREREQLRNKIEEEEARLRIKKTIRI